MQILQIPEEIEQSIPTQHGRPLEPGRDYIATNAFAGVMLLSRHKVTIKGKEWSLRLLLKSYSIEFDKFDPSEDWNNKDVWLYRGGGYGDLLLLTPLIRELKNRWPEIWIHVACGTQYNEILNGMGVICEELPIPYSKDTNIDCLIEFEEIVEGDPKARELHMGQLFADRAGITLATIKPEYRVTKEERDWALLNYPKIPGSLPRIGIQFLASAIYRSYPKMDQIIMKLTQEAQVFLIGSPGQIIIRNDLPNLINLMEDKLDFRHSAAVISTCDVCVSPDSALVHLCSALDIPCVCLYGPFPSELRVSSSLAYSFNGKADCAPCFFHAELSNQFPADKPCSKVGKCVALDSISVQRVVDRVLSSLPVSIAQGQS